MKGFSKYLRDFFTKEGRMGQLRKKGLEKYPLHKYYTGGGKGTGIAGPVAAAGAGFAVGGVTFNKDDTEEDVRKKFTVLANKKTKNKEYAHPDLRNLMKADTKGNLRTSEILKASKSESSRLGNLKKPAYTDTEIDQERAAEGRGVKTTGEKLTERPLDRSNRARIDRNVSKLLSEKDHNKFKDSIESKFRVLYVGGKVQSIVDPNDIDPETGNPRPLSKGIVTKYKKSVSIAKSKSESKKPTTSRDSTSVRNVGATSKGDQAYAKRIVSANLPSGTKEEVDQAVAKVAGQVAGMRESGLSESEIKATVGRIISRSKSDKIKRENLANQVQPETPLTPDQNSARKITQANTPERYGGQVSARVQQQEADRLTQMRKANENSIRVKENEDKKIARVKLLASPPINPKTNKPFGKKTKAYKDWEKSQSPIEKDGEGTKPISNNELDYPNLKSIFQFDRKKDKKENIIGATSGGTLGALAATKRHRDWRLYDKIEKEQGRKLNPKHKLKANLRLHGGSLGYLSGGALLGYGISRALQKRKKRNELQRLQGRKS